MRTIFRSILVYLTAMFAIAFLMPLFSPTDKPPAAAPPTPVAVVVAQCLAVYGLPVAIVLIDIRQRRN